MNTKKNIFLVFPILILLSVIILSNCGRDNMQSEKASLNFSEIIEYGNLNDFSLTIYYMSPFKLTRFPLSVDDLVYGITAVNEPPREKNDKNGLYEQKFVINGRRLEEYVDLLIQLSNTQLIPAEKESYLNARIYYVFETEKEGKIFDVAMWGGENNSIFVNGLEVEGKDVFYDIIMPFLSEDAAEELNNWRNRGLVK